MPYHIQLQVFSYIGQGCSRSTNEYCAFDVVGVLGIFYPLWAVVYPIRHSHFLHALLVEPVFCWTANLIQTNNMKVIDTHVAVEQGQGRNHLLHQLSYISLARRVRY